MRRISKPEQSPKVRVNSGLPQRFLEDEVSNHEFANYDSFKSSAKQEGSRRFASARDMSTVSRRIRYILDGRYYKANV